MPLRENSPAYQTCGCYRCWLDRNTEGRHHSTYCRAGRYQHTMVQTRCRSRSPAENRESISLEARAAARQEANFAARQSHEDYTPAQWAQWRAEVITRQYNQLQLGEETTRRRRHQHAINIMIETLEEKKKEKNKLVQQMIDEQNAHMATRELLDEERKAVDMATDRMDVLRNQKLGLEAGVEQLTEELKVATLRTKLQDGDRDSIRHCSDNALETSITTTMEALSRMHCERSDRGRRAVRCVNCLDKEKTVLLRPCNHLCICESCKGTVQTCPLCRQDIQEKISVRA